MAAVEPGTRQPDDTGATRSGEAGRRAARKPVPKLRERKHGAAIPLDDVDKRLLNLMQGSFPITERPYQHVATEAGIRDFRK